MEKYLAGLTFVYIFVAIYAHPVLITAVFHSIISPPAAKNFDIEIIFYIHASLKKFILLVQSLKIFIFRLTFR